MPERKDMRALAVVAAMGAATLNAGCTTFLDPVGAEITPQAVVSKPGVATSRKQYTLVEAEQFAQAVRQGYHQRIKDQILLQNSLNLAFIPIAGLAAFYGVSSAHSDVVLGLTIAGAGTYLVGQTLTNKTDQLIYAGGMLAVGCVLDSFASVRSAYAYRDELFRLVGGPNYDANGKATVSLGEIERKVDRLGALLPTGQEAQTGFVIAARALIDEARSVQGNGQTALAILDGAGSRLINAVQDVQARTTQAIVANRPDAGALRDAARAAFAASATGALSAPKAAPTAGAAASGAMSATIKAEIENVMEGLRADLRRVQIIVAAVSQPPDAQALRKCDIDVDAAGLTLRASVGDSTTVVKSDKDIDIAFGISGGRKPYGASWEGQTYSDLMSAPVITSGGQLTAKLKKEIPSGAYRIAISDLNANTIAVNVIVWDKANGTPAPSSGRGQDGTATGCAVDADVKAVQDFLIAQGVTTADVAGEQKTLTSDGCMGSITRAAIEKFMQDNSLLPIPTEDAELIRSMKEAMEAMQ